MRFRWTTTALGFCLSAALTGLCWWASGVGLGLFFGAAAVVATLAGPLFLVDDEWPSGLLASGAVMDGAGVVLLGAVVVSTITFMQWLWCWLVLIAFGLALAGAAAGMARMVRSRMAGAVISIIMGYAWLTWPIGLAEMIESPSAKGVARTVLAVHPWMTMNRPLLAWGTWSTGQIAYHHARIHDWGEVIPGTVFPCIAWHAGIGIALLWLACRRASAAGDAAE